MVQRTALLRIRRYRQGTVRLGGVMVFHSLGSWMSYLDVAYPTKPADYAEYMAALRAKLTEPGRMPSSSRPSSPRRPTRKRNCRASGARP
jgi:hypothetical protein